MAPPTIIAHKSAFISTQTLHLSQPLEPSAAWRAANEGAQEGTGLSFRAVDDAVYHLNHILTQHARRVYAPQASRHVAEQIEGLFHAEAQRALRGSDAYGNDVEGEGGDNERTDKRAPRVGADLTTDKTIASLPVTWDHLQRPHQVEEAAANPLEARRYAELAAHLASLSARRREVRERVERLRRMAALLAPFVPGDKAHEQELEQQPQDDPTSSSTTRRRTTVQENLVTRNGEIERELERMRLLLVRVAGRVRQLPDKESRSVSNDGENEEDGTMDIDSIEQAKIQRLLDGL